MKLGGVVDDRSKSPTLRSALAAIGLSVVAIGCGSIASNPSGSSTSSTSDAITVVDTVVDTARASAATSVAPTKTTATVPAVRPAAPAAVAAMVLTANWGNPVDVKFTCDGKDVTMFSWTEPPAGTTSKQQHSRPAFCRRRFVVDAMRCAAGLSGGDRRGRRVHSRVTRA